MKKLIVFTLSILLLQGCSKEDNDSLHNPIIDSYEDFVDSRDGNVYKTVKIGNQVWLAENLRYRLAQGSYEGCYTYGENNIVLSTSNVAWTPWRDSIVAALNRGEIVDDPNVIPPQKGLATLLRERVALTNATMLINEMLIYPKVDNMLMRIRNNILMKVAEQQAALNLASADILHGDYSKNYGLMYTFESAKKAIPDGWRIPTDEDWKILEGNLGISNSELDKLNAWRDNKSSNFLASNAQSVGFNAQLAGSRVYGSFGVGTPFMNKDVVGYYWTSTLVQDSEDSEVALVRNFMRNQEGVWRGTSKLSAAYHIKLIKKN